MLHRIKDGQIANADDRADTVIGKALQMVDKIVAGEHLLRHRAGGHVLIADVAMQINHGRHHRLAGESDARCAGGDRQLAAPADCREAIVLDDERGVLDGAAVTGNEPPTFEHRQGAGRLAPDLRQSRQDQQQKGD